jgi:cyclase
VYVGDPINVLRILNQKEVDEVVVLDICASRRCRSPDLAFIEELTSECFMPLCYGGGVTSVEEMRRLFRAGVEKVAVNSAGCGNLGLFRAAAAEFGSQSVVASIDVGRRLWGGRQVFVAGGRRATGQDPVEYARAATAAGAGEILLGSIERDGTMSGYDLELIASVSSAVEVPVIAVGGASGLDDLKAALARGADACAAGSLFVFQGPNRAVLIRYPAVAGWPP